MTCGAGWFMSGLPRTSDSGQRSAGSVVAGLARRQYSVLLALVLAQDALAQPATQLELEACAAITTDRERLQCFEMLTRRGSSGSLHAGNEQPDRKQPDREQRSGGTALPSGLAAPDSAPARATVISPHNDPPGAPDPAADSPLHRPPGPSRQVEDNDPPQPAVDVPMEARVVMLSESLRGNLRFHFDNGQIWHQIEARHVPLPSDLPFTVRLSAGLFGETRLRVGEKGRLVRIRRLQ